MEQAKQIRVSQLNRDKERLKLEEKQKIDGFGAKKWPSKSDVVSEIPSISISSNKPIPVEINQKSDDTTYKNEDAYQVPETQVACRSEVTPKEYPGCIGFNGHQVVFHCYGPGQAYLPRNGCKDPCTLKLTSLPTGEQVCAIVYDKPPRPPGLPKLKICKTDRQTYVKMTDLGFPPEKKEEVQDKIKKPDSAKSKKKGKGKGKVKGKGKGKKKK